MLNQCRLLASAASVMASPQKQIPLIISMLFAHHKKLVTLEKRLEEHGLDESRLDTGSLPKTRTNGYLAKTIRWILRPSS
jgi:hypothetical protein